MCFYNIICQAQTQAGSLPGGFGGEEGLEDLIDDFFWNTITVVANGYLYTIFNLACFDADGWVKIGCSVANRCRGRSCQQDFTFFADGVESVGDKIQ